MLLEPCNLSILFIRCKLADGHLLSDAAASEKDLQYRWIITPPKQFIDFQLNRSM